MLDIAEIRSEIQNDPASLNYAALVAASDDQGIADLMNNTLEPVLGWVKRNEGVNVMKVSNLFVNLKKHVDIIQYPDLKS